LLHRLATDAAAKAAVKYTGEHPREKMAAIYRAGSAEDTASCRKGPCAVEQEASNAALADPTAATAAASWDDSATRIRKRKIDSSE
jgi:hypothetical protein